MIKYEKGYFFFIIISNVITVVPITANGKQITTEEDDINLPTAFVSAVQNKNELKKLPVEVKAKSAVLMDAVSGKVLLEYNKDLPVFPASVTKIMTVLLVCEAINSKKIKLTDTASCTENAASKGGSQIWLEPGEVMTVEELLRATVIGSANDAATLLGEYVSGSEIAFIELMNKRAKELNMNGTEFENATGLDDTSDSHITTAYDVAVMSRELLKYEFVRKYTTTWMDSLRNGETQLVNTNKLVRFYDGTTGLKTGTTAKAGCCISASAKRGNVHLIAVVMGSANSKDRFETAKSLLNYGFSAYTSYQPSLNKEFNDKVTVRNGQKAEASVNIPKLLPILTEKGKEEDIKVEVKMKDVVLAPVKKGDVVGTVTVKNDDEIINEYKITSKDDVLKLDYFDCLMIVLNILSKGVAEYPCNT